jgi:hypothetical protein
MPDSTITNTNRGLFETGLKNPVAMRLAPALNWARFGGLQRPGALTAGNNEEPTRKEKRHCRWQTTARGGKPL